MSKNEKNKYKSLKIKEKSDNKLKIKRKLLKNNAKKYKNKSKIRRQRRRNSASTQPPQNHHKIYLVEN